MVQRSGKAKAGDASKKAHKGKQKRKPGAVANAGASGASETSPASGLSDGLDASGASLAAARAAQATDADTGSDAADVEGAALNDGIEGYAEGDRAQEFIFHKDEATTPAESKREERWYKVVEQKLATLPSPEGKDRRTWDGVFDRRTMMTLYKLLSNELISALDFPISTGKEADVFRASTPEGTFVCVKIFRTNTATFHDVLQYIQGDPRFKGIKPEKHGLVKAWAQKEYRNLGRMIDSGVRVPEPIVCLDNVLVMEYIGTEEGPYAILKDVVVEEPEETAEKLLGDYHRMLTQAKLVHADISEYNVLWAGTEPVIIDVGQAVLVQHPMAEEFFERDVRNMSRFMTKFGAKRSLNEVRETIFGSDIEHFGDLL